MDRDISIIKNQLTESGNPEVHTLSPSKIQVMVQDCHSLYLEGFTWALRNWGFDVLGNAHDAVGLLELICSKGLPDITIINYKTSRPESLFVASQILGVYSDAKIIMNASANFWIPIDKMKSIGIKGVIFKIHHTSDQIVRALHTVYNGGTFYSCSKT